MPKHQDSLIFNDVDLAANRAGHLTDGQRKLIQAETDEDERSIYLLRLGFGILGSLCVCLALLFSNPSLLLVGGGLLLVYTVVTVTIYRGYQRLQEDIDSGIVMMDEGLVVYQLRKIWGGHDRLKIIIGSLEFGLAGWGMYRIFQEGVYWRVYYLPRTKHIISAEQPE